MHLPRPDGGESGLATDDVGVFQQVRVNTKRREGGSQGDVVGRNEP